MAGQNRPQQPDDTQATQQHRAEQTRPNRRAEDDTRQNKKNRTELLNRTPSPPTGQVNPLSGSRQQVAPRGYARRPQTSSKDDSALYLPWWSIVVMLIGVIIVSFGIMGSVYFIGGGNLFTADPSPVIVVVTADPNAIGVNGNGQPLNQAPSTEIISGQNAPTSLQLSGPTLAPVVISPTPAAVRIGSEVAVDGVDVNTLNVRSVPNLAESEVLFRAEEGTIFVVIDGPQQSNGFTWWQIQDPLDANRIGWAVSNFLQVQSP